MAFTSHIFIKPKIEQWHYANMFYIYSHPNQSRNVGSTGRNSSTPLISKIWLSVNQLSWISRFLYNPVQTTIVPNFMQIQQMVVLLKTCHRQKERCGLHKQYSSLYCQECLNAVKPVYNKTTRGWFFFISNRNHLI